MSISIAPYQHYFNLQNATFSRIEHDDAIVAIVYVVTLPTSNKLILKICPKSNHYFREVYFLSYFAGKLPTPRLLDHMPPQEQTHGAILMEYLPGSVPKITTLTKTLAYEMGSLLAHIHCHPAAGYGELAPASKLNDNPQASFRETFEEALAECAKHLPKTLLDKCKTYFDSQEHLLLSVDGPCIIHRDFRPGNILVHHNNIQGIIDWSSGRASFVEEDFCSMEHGEWSVDDRYKQQFLNGYAQIRTVPDYQEIMPFLRMNRTIATLGFLIKKETCQNKNSNLYKLNRHFLETFLFN